MPQFLTVNTVAELICFSISLFCLFNEKNQYWKSFMYYMFLVCIVEMTGIYLTDIRIPNQNMYSVFLLVECGIISTFFYHLFSKYNHTSKPLFIWMAIFLIIFIMEAFVNNFHYFAYRTAAFISVVFVIASLYFYLLIMRDEHFRKLSTYPDFWMVNGILFFYFGSTACNLFFEYLVQEKLITVNLSIRYPIFNILNILLYSCWSYAFICRYRQRRLSS